MIILAIESSCDESAAAIVKDGRTVLSSVMYSQIQEHQDWGGVIPEHASRLHYEKIHKVIDTAFQEASSIHGRNLSFQDIDAIGVTIGPGLMGSLLIGVNVAQTLAWVHDKPLIPVNHLDGHISSNYLDSSLEPPFLCMLASGGHTQIISVKEYAAMEIMGSSIDDAVGEAFDKTARLMGLPYPGGPELDLLAQSGKANSFYNFPIPNVDAYNFSFSGLKTAVLRLKEKIGDEQFLQDKADIAYAFQDCVAKILTRKIKRASEEIGMKKIIIAGGVSANSRIRTALKDEFSEEKGFSCYMPNLKYCTDNAAMIASAAYFKYLASFDKAKKGIACENAFRNYASRSFSTLKDTVRKL